MQAIVTKYLGPTNNRGSRIKVWCDAKTLTVAWDHALNVTDNHAKAVKALLDSLGWGGTWVMGAAPDRGTNVYGVATCARRLGESATVVIGPLTPSDVAALM